MTLRQGDVPGLAIRYQARLDECTPSFMLVPLEERLEQPRADSSAWISWREEHV